MTRGTTSRVLPMSDEKSVLDQDEQAAAEAAQVEAQRLQRLIEVDDLKWFMGSKQGRRLMWRLLAQAGVYRTSFVAPNAMQVSFLEGQRTIGLEWLGEIMEHCPESFHQMTMEYQAYAKRVSSTSSRSSSSSRSGSTNTR